jgi:hypothetical protein
MALPNIQDTIIATGYNCQVRIGTNSADAEHGVIAMVSSFQYTQDFQAQDATCIGNLGPVSIDPQGYMCTITLEGFLPAKKTLDDVIQYADGGKKAIMDHVPSRAQFMEGGAMPKIAYMDFYNKKEGKVLAAFEGVMITNEGSSVEGNSYVRNNVQMRALCKT